MRFLQWTNPGTKGILYLRSIRKFLIWLGRYRHSLYLWFESNHNSLFGHDLKGGAVFLISLAQCYRREPKLLLVAGCLLGFELSVSLIMGLLLYLGGLG